MIVTYTPADGEKRSWPYRASDLPSADAEDIEEVSGVLFDTWQFDLVKGGAKARHALLWVLLRRDTPGLKFQDVSFNMGELTVEFEADEKVRIRAAIEKSTDLSDDDKSRALATLQDDEDEVKDDPKYSAGVHSGVSDSSTGQSSPTS